MTKRKKKFTGSEEAQEFIQWLESASAEESERVLEIKQLYENLKKASTKKWQATYHPALQRLQALLNRYSYLLLVIITPKGTVTEFRPAVKTALPLWGESHAVLQVQALFRMGLLSQVRRCESCSKWTFSKFRTQRFCSVQCRVKHAQSDPAWKKRSNALRRRKYELKKRGLL